MIKINFVEDGVWNFNPEKVAKTIAKVISKKEKIKGIHYISVIMVDGNEIHRLNKEYRNIDSETDVISFACIDDLENVKVKHGYPVELDNIFISIKHVINQADAYNHSVLREFAFLVAHGIYHLLGYDHMNEEDEKIMFAKQEEVLTKLKITRGQNE